MLLQTIMGIGDVISGTMSLEGKAFRPRNPKDAWHHAIAYVPGDRTGEGLIPEFAIEENLTLSARPVKAGIFVDRSRGGIITSEMLSKLKIKTSDQSQATSTLSGGNMQKVVLGKCLATRPRLLLLDNPTRGVDVGAKAEIYRHIRSLADDGMTILMVTEDLGELIGMADEIIVTRKGQISCRFEVGQKALGGGGGEVDDVADRPRRRKSRDHSSMCETCEIFSRSCSCCP